MVTKPGKVRICLDCRKANSFTEKDAYPLPQISGILSLLVLKGISKYLER